MITPANTHSFFFFFNDTATTEIYTFPYTTLFRSALDLGKRTVKEILSTYHKAGQVAVPALESKGKPPYRIQPALETEIGRHTSELQSPCNLVCRLLLEKKNTQQVLCTLTQ